MGSSKMTKILKPDTKIYLWIIAILVIMLFYFDKIAGSVGVILLLYLNVYNWRSNRIRKKKWTKYFEEITSDLDSAASHAILNSPIPLILIDFDGKITWYNSKFTELVDKTDLIGASIDNVVPSIDIINLLENQIVENIKIGDKYFKVLCNSVKLDEKEDTRYIMMLYWIETTRYNSLKDEFEDGKPVVAQIQVDNFDDVLSEMKEDKKPFIDSEINNIITTWASRMNGLIKRYNNDKYIVIFENKYLENLEAKKFSILDDIREIDCGNKVPVTLSIGIGVGTDSSNYYKLEESAFSSLELALGRGGDQAVIKKHGNFDFYGGKTKAVEKRNKVKARIIAHAFRPIIDESSEVIIMGHKYPDMDCYGAAIGVYRAAINRGRDAYIVLNDVTEAIKNIHEVFDNNQNYKFITSEEALEMANKNSLLVIVDTHKPSITECPDLIKEIDNVVVFDHHRRGTEFVENTVLKYLEPYASSTCELVTEMLQYMDAKMNIEKIEAEALMAGIAVDTKNFTFKTGVRTFQAASLLRKFGADTTIVKQFFQDDLSTFINKSSFVSNAVVYDHQIAISTNEKEVPNGQLIAAQAADDLLSIRGISTSFVLSNSEGTIYISARSLGDTNVQIILEKLGGGGHMTVAGAQFTDATMEEAKEKLVEAINEYFEEGVK